MRGFEKKEWSDLFGRQCGWDRSNNEGHQLGALGVLKTSSAYDINFNLTFI